MDVKDMRAVAEAVSEHTSCGCDASVGVVHCPSCDARYLAKLMLVLTCPDPLTLDAAVKVVGREPRESCSTIFVWDDESIFVTKNTHEDRVSIVRMWGKDFYLPTIGQFAMLVGAARMGEKA